MLLTTTPYEVLGRAGSMLMVNASGTAVKLG